MNTGRTCQRCGGLFQAVLPGRLEVERELAGPLAADQSMEFIRVLRSKTGCDLKDAKGTMQHISQAGRCHRCDTLLTAGRIVDCPKCGSMNIVLNCEIGAAPISRPPSQLPASPEIQRKFTEALGDPFLVSLSHRDDCFCWSMAQSPERQQKHVREALERFLQEHYNHTGYPIFSGGMFSLYLEQGTEYTAA